MRASVLVFACVALYHGGLSDARAADLSEHAVETPAPHDYYFGASARFFAGDLDRESTNFFALKDNHGKNTVDPSFLSYSNDDDVSGFEAEAYIGRKIGDRAIELVVGGGFMESDVSASGDIIAAAFLQDKDNSPKYYLTLNAPDPDKNLTFQWIVSNRFDCLDCDYKNDFDRQEYFIGLRPALLFGGEPDGLKDGGSWKDSPEPVARSTHAFKPMVFASFGEVSVDERFSGGTDNNPPVDQGGNGGLDTGSNVIFDYKNDIESDFYGLGFGVSLTGPIANVHGVRLGYFGAFKGAAEFHDAEGSSSLSYYAAWGNVNGFQGNPADPKPGNFRPGTPGNQVVSSVKTEADEVAYTLAAEAGVTFGLLTGVDLEVGGRFRRIEVPQLVLNGSDTARIEFEAADELTGFLGLKAQF